jgi:hypothetical protein
VASAPPDHRTAEAASQPYHDDPVLATLTDEITQVVTQTALSITQIALSMARRLQALELAVDRAPARADDPSVIMGATEAAKVLGIDSRTMRKMCRGEKPFPDGWRAEKESELPGNPWLVRVPANDPYLRQATKPERHAEDEQRAVA